MFKAVMVTILISGGHAEKVSETKYATMNDCLLHKHQKEYTEYSTPEGFYAFFCGHVLVEGATKN